MTFYLWFMLALALGGCWAIWKFQEQKIKKLEEDLAGAKVYAARYLTAVRLCHTVLFGPLETPTERITQAFNDLWKLAGLEEKGFQ